MNKKHAIITGGSSGIGKAVAAQLARQGYDISIIAQDQIKLDKAVEEIKAQCVIPDKQHILAFSADVRQEVAFTRLLKKRLACKELQMY